MRYGSGWCRQVIIIGGNSWYHATPNLSTDTTLSNSTLVGRFGNILFLHSLTKSALGHAESISDIFKSCWCWVILGDHKLSGNVWDLRGTLIFDNYQPIISCRNFWTSVNVVSVSYSRNLKTKHKGNLANEEWDTKPLTCMTDFALTSFHEWLLCLTRICRTTLQIN